MSETINLSQMYVPLDEYGYVKQNLNYHEKEIYLQSTNTYIKNKKRYRKSTFKCKSVIGFDSETYMGKCKMLCRSKGRDNTIYNPCFAEILDFLFYDSYESHTYRFFYNLSFDINAILKVWDNDLKIIDEEYSAIPEIIDLLDGKPIQYGAYTITYLRGKLFTLRKNRKVVHFTDLWQFYQTSLDNAGFEFLGKRKYHNVNTARLNEDLEYWDEHYDEIKHYCLRDCEILAELGYKLINAVKDMGIELPKYLCSSASFSKAHFMKKSWIPSITSIPKSILEIGHHTYSGGRFEIFQMGYFKYLESYDINSQYPAMIRRLPSFKYGVWEPTYSIPKTETLGFYYVHLNIPKTCNLPTIPIKINNVITFPVGYIEGWFTWFDLDLMRDYITNIFIGYEYHEGISEYHPFRDEIDNLFQQKSDIKEQIKVLLKKYPILSELYKFDEIPNEIPLDVLNRYQLLNVYYMLIKLTINALYGCFVETNENSEGKSYGGRLFNPVNATFITAYGRWSVVKSILPEDYKHIIAIHTDSVIMDKPIDYLDCGLEIGLWAKENSGKSFVLGCGQYQIGKKIATRSYNKKQIGSWFTLVERYKDNSEIVYKKSRMNKIAEMIRDKKSIDLVNIMEEKEKHIRLNSDRKRIWDIEYSSFGQMLGTKNQSRPFWVALSPNKKMIILPT